MRRILALAMVLALLGASALAEAFTFRNGIQWGMTRQQVIAIEGAAQATYENTTPQGKRWVDLVYENVAAAGATAVMNLIFFEDELVICDYTFGSGDITFDRLAEALAAKYGEASEADSERINTIVAPFVSETTPDNSGKNLCWSLEDGTLIILTDSFGDIEILYANEPRILEIVGSGEEEPAIDVSGL